MAFQQQHGIPVAALALLLAGCGEKDERNLATPDAELTNDTADARKEALRMAGGKLMRTPTATKEAEPVGLGGLAGEKRGGACAAARVRYDKGWAARMPPAFPVYPGGQVTEAAGLDNAPCGLRAVSFTTTVRPDEVMDFYYTMARHAGYSAEHVEQNGEHVLGGTRERDDGAFYVSLTALRSGGAAVDLIALGGL